MSIYKGYFHVELYTVKTKITIEITKCYNVYIWFMFDGKSYKFTIPTWRKLVGSESFDIFARMMLERYKYDKHPLGSIKRKENTITVSWNITEMILYAVFDMFNYMDDIMSQYANEIVEYCSVHQHDPINKYEDYIHFILCECILESKFSVGRKCYEKMSYDREYDGGFWDGITPDSHESVE